MGGVAFTVRRLVHPLLWPLPLVFLLFCGVMLPMFLPMRIDHHGWQLAMLSLTVAGLADDARRRGGLLGGLASAASLAVGGWEGGRVGNGCVRTCDERWAPWCQ